ncbi:MAG: sel1 repeat family protein [Sulfurovaceae bacterium]|nr:sel1 repeat family protein [Sulfurovaceae bacterium]
MKTLLITILLITISINLNAKTTNIYEHSRYRRVAYQAQKTFNKVPSKLFFAMRAAKEGNPRAQFDLAVMYATGRYIRKNEREAFYWFHKSARNGFAEAKYYMGISFEQGRGVKPNKYLARYWFKQAVISGYSKAMYHLSQIEKYLNYRRVMGNRYAMR